MSGFNMTEWIARSPKEVFDFIAASENAPKVAPNIKSMAKLTEGTVGVGTRYRETRLMNGKEAQAELEIVNFEPGQRYAMKNATEGIETIYRYTFTSEKDGRSVQKPQPTKSRVKKVANRPLLIPRMVFENGKLWGAFEKERSD